MQVKLDYSFLPKKKNSNPQIGFKNARKDTLNTPPPKKKNCIYITPANKFFWIPPTPENKNLGYKRNFNQTKWTKS